MFSAILSLFLFLLSVSILHYIIYLHRQNLISQNNIIEIECLKNFSLYFNEKIYLLESLGRKIRDDFKENKFTKKSFIKLASDFYSYENGIRAINWIDPDGKITIVFPYEPNKGALNRSLLHHKYARDTFLDAKYSLKPSVTDVIPLFQGSCGIAFYYPIVINGKLKGFLNLVLSLGKFIEKITENYDSNFVLILKDSKKIFYNSYNRYLKEFDEIPYKKYYIYGKSFKIKGFNKRIFKKSFKKEAIYLIFISLFASILIYLLFLNLINKIYEIRKLKENLLKIFDAFPQPIFVFKESNKKSKSYADKFKIYYINSNAQKLLSENYSDGNESFSISSNKYFSVLKDLYFFKNSVLTKSIRNKGIFTLQIEQKIYLTSYTFGTFGIEKFLIFSLMDITEEVELRRILENVVHTTTDTIIIIDKDYTYREAFLYGKLDYIQTPSKFLGKKIGEVTKDPRNKRAAELFLKSTKKAFNEKTHVSFEYEMYINDKHVYIKAYLIPFKRWGKDAVLAILKDITQMKKFEKRMILEERANAVSNLIAGLTHDFNNYLSIIKLSLEMLERILCPEKKENDEVVILLKSIKETIDNSEKLLNQILNYNKEMISKSVEINLNSEIHKAIKIIKNAYKKIEIKFKENKKDLKILFAENKIFDIIYNLVKNSIENIGAPEKTKIEILIDIENFESIENLFGEELESISNKPSKEKLFAKVEVSDNGSGIPEDKISEVFKPFFTTKKFGTGLGLSQVYGIIKKFKGFIFLKNRKEGGLSVYIYLPLIDKYEEDLNGQKKNTIN